MMRKWFATVALSALIFAGVVVPYAVAAQSQPATQAEQPQMRTTTGKVTSVSGQMFSIEIGQGNTKQTLQFVTDSTTAKSGELKVGATATVQYHPGSDGKNTATKVDIQG